MKIRFTMNTAANIYSSKSDIVDVEDTGHTPEEWLALTEDEKYKVAETWAWNSGLDISFEELDD